MSLETFSAEELAELTLGSKSAKRKRAIQMFNEDSYAGPHVGVNVIQPESYIRPHLRYHDETILHCAGRLAHITFGENGEFVERRILGDLGESVERDFDLKAIWVPKETFQTVVALEPDSAIYMIVQGPHDPNRFSEHAQWAPVEGSPSAPSYLENLRIMASE